MRHVYITILYIYIYITHTYIYIYIYTLLSILICNIKNHQTPQPATHRGKEATTYTT